VKESGRRTRLCRILYVGKLKGVSKQLIIKWILVEAAGVEPFIPI
jgi:hypothetical protein